MTQVNTHAHTLSTPADLKYNKTFCLDSVHETDASDQISRKQVHLRPTLYNKEEKSSWKK